jgi:hypothetical protein
MSLPEGGKYDKSKIVVTAFYRIYPASFWGLYHNAYYDDQ